jgi:hypothetical protein
MALAKDATNNSISQANRALGRMNIDWYVNKAIPAYVEKRVPALENMLCKSSHNSNVNAAMRDSKLDFVISIITYFL